MGETQADLLLGRCRPPLSLSTSYLGLVVLQIFHPPELHRQPASAPVQQLLHSHKQPVA